MGYTLAERAIYSFSFGRIPVKFGLIQGHRFHAGPQKILIFPFSNSYPSYQRNNKPKKKSTVQAFTQHRNYADTENDVCTHVTESRIWKSTP